MFSNSYLSAPLSEASQSYIALPRQPFAELSKHPTLFHKGIAAIITLVWTNSGAICVL